METIYDLNDVRTVADHIDRNDYCYFGNDPKELVEVANGGRATPMKYTYVNDEVFHVSGYYDVSWKDNLGTLRCDYRYAIPLLKPYLPRRTISLDVAFSCHAKVDASARTMEEARSETESRLRGILERELPNCDISFNIGGNDEV